MKALSIKQPWAWLIANGYKDIENRSWPTKYRGQFLIHAGMKFDDGFDYEWAEDIIKVKIPLSPRRGAIIGQAEIVDCVQQSDSPWFFGEYGFIIRNGKQFFNPKPCKGKLGFFTPMIEHPTTKESKHE